MILSYFVNLWRHWVGTFLDLFPNWLIAPGFSFQRPVLVKVNNLDHFFDNPLKFIEKGARSPIAQLHGRLIDISLSEANVLERHIKLPKMSKKHFAKAVEISLQKASPIPVDHLTWRQKTVKTDGGSIATKQYVIKNERLALLEQTVTAFGLRLRTVTVDAADSVFLDRSIEYDRSKRIWLLINLGILITFCLWTGFSKYNQLEALQRANTTLAVEISELQTTAIKRTQMAASQKDATALAQKTSTELRMGQSRTEFLENLSGFLGDEVWVSELSINGANVSLGGFSTTDVASLVSNLRDEDWVSDAHLKSAISGARTSKSKRFQIQLELKTLGVGTTDQ